MGLKRGDHPFMLVLFFSNNIVLLKKGKKEIEYLFYL